MWRRRHVGVPRGQFKNGQPTAATGPHRACCRSELPALLKTVM